MHTTTTSLITRCRKLLPLLVAAAGFATPIAVAADTEPSRPSGSPAPAAGRLPTIGTPASAPAKVRAALRSQSREQKSQRFTRRLASQEFRTFEFCTGWHQAPSGDGTWFFRCKYSVHGAFGLGGGFAEDFDYHVWSGVGNGSNYYGTCRYLIAMGWYWWNGYRWFGSQNDCNVNVW